MHEKCHITFRGFVIRLQVQVPAALFLTQLSADVPEKGAENSLSSWAHAQMWETQVCSWLLASAWCNSDHHSHLESEPAHERDSSLPLSFSITHTHRHTLSLSLIYLSEKNNYGPYIKMVRMGNSAHRPVEGRAGNCRAEGPAEKY